ncbi:MAG: NUDIX domain-containing protein [Nanoarchaeota archaeon]|nr:NUDIX domain-containing protein [Nanoarchaeota archaeon]
MTSEYIPFEAYSKLHHQSHGYDGGMTSSGTWGRGGAGILIVSPELDEFLLLKRSGHVLDPYMWGIPGGARKEVETGLEEALITAVTESREEMGLLPRGKMRKNPYVYQKPHTDFTYQTFILEIDPEDRTSFVPQLNWENTDYCWIRRDSVKDILLHPGVQDVLDNYQF